MGRCMVMAQSLFITLKNARPDCQIDVPAPSWSFSLLERMPEVAKVVAEKFNLTHSEYILTLCPGAEYGAAKRWTALKRS